MRFQICNVSLIGRHEIGIEFYANKSQRFPCTRLKSKRSGNESDKKANPLKSVKFRK